MRILVIGGDGMIGGALDRSLTARGHDVIVTTRRRNRSTDEGATFLDLSEAEANCALLPEVDIAVICAAMARFTHSRNLPELAQRVNVTTPIALSAKLASRGTRVILLSTSAVFDCKGPHIPDDRLPAPRSAYGRLKAEAESGVLALGAGATIVRLTKVLTSNSGILFDWIGALACGQTVRAFEDHRLCPITRDDALGAIAAIAERGDAGVYQVSGAADISYADAARHLCNRIGVPPHRVIPVTAVDSGIPPDEVTPYTSLDTRRLSALTGFVPPEPLAVFDAVYGSSLAVARAQLGA